MAQDDSVVSAQWLHEHLGQPDVKVKQFSILSSTPHAILRALSSEILLCLNLFGSILEVVANCS
jgi:3-mercaptopyruvate sulfurtransferase SseA